MSGAPRPQQLPRVRFLRLAAICALFILTISGGAVGAWHLWSPLRFDAQSWESCGGMPKNRLHRILRVPTVRQRMVRDLQVEVLRPGTTREVVVSLLGTPNPTSADSKTFMQYGIGPDFGSDSGGYAWLAVVFDDAGGLERSFVRRW